MKEWDGASEDKGKEAYVAYPLFSKFTGIPILPGDSSLFYVLRGGSWRNDDLELVTSTSRAHQSSVYTSNFIGFRCAVSEKDVSTDND